MTQEPASHILTQPTGLLELMGMKPEDRQKEVDAVIQQAEPT